jgi:hypothetical protein
MTRERPSVGVFRLRSTFKAATSTSRAPIRGLPMAGSPKFFSRITSPVRSLTSTHAKPLFLLRSRYSMGAPSRL